MAMIMTYPANPNMGDYFIDTPFGQKYIWTGKSWVQIVPETFSITVQPDMLIPTEEQLEKYVALKAAWEEYLIVRKLIGL